MLKQKKMIPVVETVVSLFLLFFQPAPLHPRGTAVDLRPDFPVVYDQGITHSCVAQAVASVVEFHERVERHHNPQRAKTHPPSRLDMYYRARTDSSPVLDSLRDEGTTVKRAIETLGEDGGVCNENMWPFSVRRIDALPSFPCRLNRHVHDFSSIDVPKTWMYVAYALRQEVPVILALDLPVAYLDYEGVRKKGVFDWKEAETCAKIYPTETHLRHAVVAVAVDERDRSFVLRNSWGSGWGDKGYVTVPRSFIDRYTLTANIMKPLNHRYE